jgi:hypothetical protein
MSWLKEGGMWLFFVAMFWFFYHNVRLIWRSYRRNIGLEIDAEGMTAYTLRPAINTKVYWNDIENIAVVEQSLFLSSIEQLHIRVPFVAPYIEAESALAKWARNRQHGTNRPITLVINVQELAITPTKLKDLIDEYLTSH